MSLFASVYSRCFPVDFGISVVLKKKYKDYREIENILAFFYSTISQYYIYIHKKKSVHLE